MPDTILSDLQRSQNTAARILTKCGDRNYPSISLLKKLHWLPVRQRITYKILILTFKAYHKTAPQYICDLIIARTYNRAVRSNNSFALVVPMIKLKHYRERSFSYAAPVEWNKLDVEIRSLSNLETFKNKRENLFIQYCIYLILHIICYNVRYCAYFCFTSAVVI